MPPELKHRTRRKISNGKYFPPGATLRDGGVNFALFSSRAQAVFLLLFDTPDAEPTDIIELKTRDRNIWHVFVEGLQAGQLYAYKVAGEFRPEAGLRFNPHKLLLDPCAKAFTGKLVNHDNLLLAYDAASPARDLSLDERENSRAVPKCVVVDDADFDWQSDRHPDIPMDELAIYEVHLKGFTAHPSSKVRHAGTYLGFIEKIPHLQALGVNAVELLPIHEHYDEDFLRNKNMVNYWGYNTLGFFAPESSYASGRAPGAAVNEFKTLVRALHKAGIEVILDVVFNHTCEGNEFGPTIMFRGIDNPSYYYLTGPAEAPARHYMDYTGCGNSLNVASNAVVTFIMNSLRYWVEVMHVDGFRFDLAAELGRHGGEFSPGAAFFTALQQDPVLSRVKLIAEPWDLGTYQVGNFPVDWAEWNGKFRDTVRKFVKGDSGQLADFSARLFGSTDLFKDGRTPFQSIKFITCHDGFTLHDLVSYNDKHNDANGEGNRDGTNDNNSWNCGTEGVTDDPAVLELRRRQIKNFAFALWLTRGTPMLLGGDEFARTQNGNNNAFCLDNETTWFDWTLAEKNRDLLRFFQLGFTELRSFRLARRRHLRYGVEWQPEIFWYDHELHEPNWSDPERRLLCVFMPCAEHTGFSHPDLFLIFNAQHTPQEIKLPDAPSGRVWHRKIDTALPSPKDFLPMGKVAKLDDAARYPAQPRSSVLLVAH